MEWNRSHADNEETHQVNMGGAKIILKWLPLNILCTLIHGHHIPCSMGGEWLVCDISRHVSLFQEDSSAQVYTALSYT